MGTLAFTVQEGDGRVTEISGATGGAAGEGRHAVHRRQCRQGAGGERAGPTRAGKPGAGAF